MQKRKRAVQLFATLGLVSSIVVTGATPVHADPGSPSIVSANATTFVVNTPGTFTVQATGDPTLSISETGALPSGVTLADNGDGTATLAGTPDPGTAGSYPFTITATNGIAPDATQDFTLTVNPLSPSITSVSTFAFTADAPGAFIVQSTGDPIPSISETGALPGGVTFTDNGNGTALLSGTPDPGTVGTYPLTITATNGVTPDATQDFTLAVNPLQPTITSTNVATFVEGFAHGFTVHTTGGPIPSISATGALPSGMSFTDDGDGTATLAGTPDPGTAGTYPLTITASNGIAPDATQDFILSVVPQQQPSILSGNTFVLVEEFDRPFIVQATGAPTPSISASGALPGGVSFTDNGNGTATLDGVPNPGTAGIYPLTITAANGVAPDATQGFTLTVIPAPPNAPEVGACSSISTIATMTPALTVAPMAVTATVRNAKPGTVVHGVVPELDRTTTLGSCSIGGGTYNDVVAGAKLSGIGSCDSASTNPGLYPLNGKLGLKYASGGLNTQAYVRIAGFGSEEGPDIVRLAGMVTKGLAVGATVGGDLFFDPVTPAPPPLQGQYLFDDTQIVVPCAQGGSAINLVYVGAGVSLLGTEADGLAFTF